MDQAQINSLLRDNPFAKLPDYPHEQRQKSNVAQAPVRHCPLNGEEKKLAIKNILRYVPNNFHAELAGEFADELAQYGHIYAFRFMPNFDLKAPPIGQIKCKSQQAAAIILMILNNLDEAVAQFPQQLVTYGGNGQVFSNWIQFRLTLRYLAEMSDKQTLVMYSGHPMGLFPSHTDAPRMVITNGMMVPNYSTKQLYDKYFVLGVTMYGQMTAGSYCYIGPQGIVHGTTITLMSAVQKYLGPRTSPAGKVFVTSGLGGMSGAQAKAAVIAGCIGVIAEVCEAALVKRHAQGWLEIWSPDLGQIIQWIREYKAKRQAISIGYLGNVVDLWECLADQPEVVELGSDQTSCHNPFNGGYYPVGLSFEEANELMAKNPQKFTEAVQKSLVRHISAIQKLSNRGMHFWDYGNAFLVECHRAGANILAEGANNDGKTFIFPSYMQHILGDIFSLGFGPFRWVCASGDPADLHRTDQIAIKVIEEFLADSSLSAATHEQYQNNLVWIQNAERHKLVVGSQARILYADLRGRIELAKAFNEAVGRGELKGPVVISRDHHDVSGTDSPYRETSNIDDGSAYCADMAIQNVIGDAFRGATWVAIHNGGGVGWGDAINGGFGMVLDGSEECAHRLASMLRWDVANGVARRSWAGNGNAQDTIRRTMQWDDQFRVTMPNEVDAKLLDNLF